MPIVRQSAPGREDYAWAIDQLSGDVDWRSGGGTL